MTSVAFPVRAALTGVVAVLVCSWSFVPAHAQPGFGAAALTFTSGPAGDGIDYPSSIGPSRASGATGITAGTAFTDIGVEFNYFGSNLAFFDANNLLTAPSTKITNDAFWTDPRVFTRQTQSGGTFSLSSIGLGIDFPLDYESFGFNLAVASLAGPVPSDLEFQIQIGFGDDAIFINDVISLVGINAYETDTPGTFQTLGSPFVGRDVSVEFFIEDLLSFGGGGEDEDGPGPDFQPEALFLDIDTSPLDNSSGISLTQIAMDNFTLDGAIVSEPATEPERFSPPTPFGPANPATFSLSGNSTNPNAVNIPGASQNGAVGLSVTSGPFTNPGDFQTTLFTTTAANVSGLNEVTFGLGSSALALSAATYDAPAGAVALTEAVNLTLVADSGQSGIEPLVLEIEAVVGAELAAALLPLFAEDGPDPADVADAMALGFPVISEAFAGLFDPGAAYYAGVSASDFLVQLEAGEASADLGAQGGTIVPTLNSDGSVVGARVATWLVTDASGLYSSITSVPEPTTLWLMLGGMAAALRHRRRS